MLTASREAYNPILRRVQNEFERPKKDFSQLEKCS
jgi:hypothetical protein